MKSFSLAILVMVIITVAAGTYLDLATGTAAEKRVGESVRIGTASEVKR